MWHGRAVGADQGHIISRIQAVVMEAYRAGLKEGQERMRERCVGLMPTDYMAEMIEALAPENRP